MVLSAQAQRNWRVAAIVCSTFAGVYSIFFADYNLDGEPHIFSDIQANRKKYLDQALFGSNVAGTDKQRDEPAEKNESTKR